MPAENKLGLRQIAVGSWRAGRLAVASAPYHLGCYVAATVAMGLIPVLAAWLLKLIVDSLTGSAQVPVTSQVGLAVGFAGTGVALGVFPHIARYAQQELRRRVTILAQDELYGAVNRFQGLARFENPTYRDRIDLARQAGLDSPGQVVHSVTGVSQGVVTMLGFLASLAVLSVPLTALVLAAALPALLAQISVSKWYARTAESTAPMIRRQIFFGSVLTDIQAIKEVRINGIGGFLRDRMLGEQRRSNQEHSRTERRDVGVQSVLSILSAAIAGTALVWGVLGARQGHLTVGDLTMMLAAVAGIQGALTSIVSGLGEGHEALLLFRHYAKVVDDGPDLPVRAAPVTVEPLRSGIEFDDVWFRYADDLPWVLRGTSFVIPVGQSCALVGVNGSGKSTLVKLLCRFYDPQRGAVRWDGVDLRDMSPADLRNRLATVFQDFMQYDLTARENVAIGDLAALADPERVEAAARLAGVHDTLAGLPRGYDTTLSRMFFGDPEEDPQNGVLLSGGQWQRVALARALIRTGRDLLVLDEPSSGLDAAAEFALHSRLREYRNGKTSLMISHRLGALRECDLIVVLQAGQVIEQGSHDDLIQLKGEYHRLFSLQARGFVAPSGVPA